VLDRTLKGSCISISLVSLRPSGIIGIRSWELACHEIVKVSILKGQRHEILNMILLQSLSTPEAFCVEVYCKLAEVKVIISFLKSSSFLLWQGYDSNKKRL
jgi:hypothetical protein